MFAALVKTLLTLNLAADIQYGGFKPAPTDENIDSYGSPQAPPVSAPDSYGSPVSPPVSAPDGYGSPQDSPLSSVPLPAAGVSIDTPVESFIDNSNNNNNYIPQVNRNSNTVTAKSKSSKAIHNGANYDPFDYQDQVSWSFVLTDPPSITSFYHNF